MIVSPFVSDAIVKRYAESGSLTLVSRPDELDKLPHATLERCERVFMLHRQAVSDDLDDRDETELDGLHAKLFVIDRRLRSVSGTLTDVSYAYAVLPDALRAPRAAVMRSR